MKLAPDQQSNLIVSMHQWWPLVAEARYGGLSRLRETWGDVQRLEDMGDAGILNADLTMQDRFRAVLDEVVASNVPDATAAIRVVPRSVV